MHLRLLFSALTIAMCICHISAVTTDSSELVLILIVAADITMECGQDIPPPNAIVSTTGPCSNANWTVTETFNPACGSSGVIVRSYLASDNCGNLASDFQIITIVDSTTPVLEFISSFITVACDEIPTADDVSAFDSCGEVTVTTEDNGFNGGCQGSISRLYTATDECGNSTTFFQIINVEDNTNPIISVPAGLFIECGDAIPAATATATDNCGDATWTVSSNTTQSCSNGYILMRTYTATDECNNTAIGTQAITVADTTAPIITVADDATIVCGDQLPPAAATTADSCGDATWTVSETFTGDCGTTGSYTRVYTATDECGNFATDTQIINTINPPQPADVNGDGVVNTQDFIDYNSQFGQFCTSCPADINVDGVVDVFDFIILNSSFGD